MNEHPLHSAQNTLVSVTIKISPLHTLQHSLIMLMQFPWMVKILPKFYISKVTFKNMDNNIMKSNCTPQKIPVRKRREINFYIKKKWLVFNLNHDFLFVVLLPLENYFECFILKDFIIRYSKFVKVPQS